MHLAIDQDDVMAEFTRHMLACVQREYGIYHDYEDVAWTDLFHKIIPGGWDWLKSRDWLWTKMPATEGAIGGVQLLREQGHTLELITSKPDWAEWCVWAWLGKWRPAFQQVTIVNGSSKFDATTADLIVDDKVSTIEEWVAGGRKAIVFDRPWNRELWNQQRVPTHPLIPIGVDFKSGGVAYRARDWSDVQAIVQSISGSDV